MELWRTDGTSEGTRLVRELDPGPGGSNLRSLCPFQDGLLFRADSRDHGNELWFSDGTAEGTVLVRDLVEGPAGSGIVRVTAAEHWAYFRADVGGLVGTLWKTKGTGASTGPVHPLGPQSAAGILNPLGNILIADGYTESSGQELWILPPNANPFEIDLNPGPAGSSPSEGTVFRDALYFQALTEAAGEELWRCNGTRQGTYMVKDIAPGPTSSDPFKFTASDDWLYFTANDGATGRELWRTDGTESGTHMVHDTWAGASEGTPYNLMPFRNGVLFTADDGMHGEELWFCAASGEVSLVRDINPGPESSSPHHGAVLDEIMYFSANDGVHGEELWQSDGTFQGTKLLADIAVPSEPPPSSNPRGLTALGNRCVFVATGSGQVTGLYASDGTQSGTEPLLLPLDLAAESLTLFTESGGFLYSSAILRDGSLALIRTDGTPEQSYLLPIDTISPNAVQQCAMAVAWGRLIVRCDLADGGTTFIATDANGDNPAILGEFSGRSGEGACVPPLLWKNVLFFAANDGRHGAELWRCTGTAQPEIVADAMPGSHSSNPRELTAYADRMYFAADGTNGPQMWVLDYVDATPRELRPPPDTRRLTPRNLCSSPVGLLFAASDPIHGAELWRVDDDTDSLVLVKDIFPGIAGSCPTEFVYFAEHVYFAAEDMHLGTELWRTDGTTIGTAMVADIYAGKEGSAPVHLTAGETVLVASLRARSTTDVVTGHEPYVLIPNATGQSGHKEILSGPQSAFPNSFCIVGNRVFFTADDGVTGRELWIWDEDTTVPRLVKDLLAPRIVQNAEREPFRPH